MFSLGKLDIHIRPPLFETAHDLGQHLVGNALIDADAQAARPARRVRAEVGLGRSQAGLDCLRVAEQNAPRLGQLDRAPAPRTLDQPLPDERLQSRDVIAHGGERAVQLRRRCPEGPGVRDRSKSPQMLYLDALPIVRHSDILRGKLMLLRRFELGRLRSWRFSWSSW